MRFRLFGTQIYVSFLFVAIIAFMIATDRTGLILPTVFAIAVHETGHLFAMWVTECEPKSVRLIPASVQIVRKMSPKPNGEISVSVMGPVANLLLFAVLYINYRLFGNLHILEFAFLNLIICIFNLLPVKGLDGGSILKELLIKKISEQKAEIIITATSLFTASAAVILGVVTTYESNFNISIFAVAIYITVCTLMKH